MKSLFVLLLFVFSIVGAGTAVQARSSSRVTIAPALDAPRPESFALTGKDGGEDDDDEEDEESLDRRASDLTALQLVDPTLLRDVLLVQSALGAK